MYSRYVGTDFRYELNFTSRMDVKLNDGFSLAPYVSYIQAQSRESKLKGSNTMIGIALSFPVPLIYDAYVTVCDKKGTFVKVMLNFAVK